VSVPPVKGQTAMQTGLIRRGGRYSIRRIVPVDLLAFYKGKREIVRALGTADPGVARELHPLAWVKIGREFTIARLSLNTADEQPKPKPRHTPEETARLAQEWEDYQQDCLKWSSQNNLDDDEVDPIKERVGEGVARRLSEIAEEQAEARRLAKAERRASTVGLMLPAIIDKWATEKRPTRKIIEQTQKTVADFYAVAGELPVTAITKKHVIAFKDDLVAKGQHPATANGRLTRLRIVLRYAAANDMIPFDPSAGIRISNKGQAHDPRTAYDAEALAAVFGSPVYTKGVRPVGGRGEAAYWLPLLGLYTGARLDELGQLRSCDVVEETYIGADDVEATAWTIRFVFDEAAGLRLKTIGSVRRIPVHPELVALGFLRYVGAAKANGQARIFPLLKPDSHGKITAHWSKWYGRYLRSVCLVTNKKIVFHSFRHTFKDNSRYSQLAPDVQNEITGHDTGDVADTYGGLSYPLHPLVEGMNKYRVPRFSPPAPSLRS
jgi:integrase